MKRFLLIAFLLNLSATISFAECATPTITHVKVDGLVCDFCARSLEKVFSKQAPVQTLKVDLTKSELTLVYKDKQSLDDKTINKLISDAGFTVNNIKRGC